MIEVIALLAPWMSLALILAASGLLIFKKYRLVCLCSLLLIAVNASYHCFTIRNNRNDYNDSATTFNVLSFNCSLPGTREAVHSKRSDIIELITAFSPDVVFLTEDFVYNDDSIWYRIQSDYPYRIDSISTVGNQIYSKYPIQIDTLIYKKDASYGITTCKIPFQGVVFYLIGVHLSSNNYNDKMEYITPDKLRTIAQLKSYLKNLTILSKVREGASEHIACLIDSVKQTNGIVPIVTMGDFNDVYGSPALNTLIRAGLKDSWWDRGFGYGATTHKPLPFRIDHILYSEKLKLESINKIDSKGISDHDALFARFSVKK